MKPFIAPVLLIISVLFFEACSPGKPDPVTRPADYAAYLDPVQSPEKANVIQQEVDFWSRRLAGRQGEPVSQAKLATALSRRYAYSGQIADLRLADSLFLEANRLQKNFSSGLYRALARNAITRHRFRDAQSYIDSALLVGDKKYASRLMAFDVALELGQADRAARLLETMSDKWSFDYLIRAARFKDHQDGDLDAAIELMEEAARIAVQREDEELICWAKTNLGDMYGHANRYYDAYACYLDALAIDRDCFHALKGIAWLAFAHDRDAENARRILNKLLQRHPDPGYHLLLAEIAGYERQEEEKERQLADFIRKAGHPSQGGMYNHYLFDLYADEWKNVSMANAIAMAEIKERPTPLSYHMLAWVRHQKGDTGAALEIVKKHVEGQCFEPLVLLRIGKIYAANGQDLKARRYLREAKESAFELGPNTSYVVN